MNYYVDLEHGNDLNSGASEDCAFKTVNCAKSVMCTGDNLLIKMYVNGALYKGFVIPV